MATERLTKVAGIDYARSFFSQDGKHYRREHQEVGHTIKHVAAIRAKHDHATKASNPNGWRHIGSIPMTMLVDWLNKHGYKMDQWARNDGGIRGKTYPESKSGVKDKFLAHFLSRDYSKLHNQHVTTKRGSSQIVVPDNYIGSSKREDIRTVKGIDS